MKILGTGSALPKKVVSNDDLAAFLDTNDEWISTRTGIRERRVLSDETLQSLAETAGRRALENAGVSPEEIDFVLVSTVQAETLSPASLPLVTRRQVSPRAWKSATSAAVILSMPSRQKPSTGSLL